MPSNKPLSLVMGRMIMCPFCEAWAPIESYTTLQMPAKHLSQCEQILKHGGESGCKALFALRHDQ